MCNKTIPTPSLNLKTNTSTRLKAHQIKNKDKMFDTHQTTITIISTITNITNIKTKEMVSSSNNSHQSKHSTKINTII